jgi:hypothetical protein
MENGFFWVSPHLAYWAIGRRGNLNDPSQLHSRGSFFPCPPMGLANHSYEMRESRIFLIGHGELFCNLRTSRTVLTSVGLVLSFVGHSRFKRVRIAEKRYYLCRKVVAATKIWGTVFASYFQQCNEIERGRSQSDVEERRIMHAGC